MTESGAMPVAFWADLSCPYAYLAHHRLRQVLPAFQGRLVLAHKSLALEYVNQRSTPKATLDLETPILALADPDLPYRPWAAPASEWPVTLWPAFEAVKCGERQSLTLADDLAWAIRVAFFRDHRCISMRHVLLDLAGTAGLDVARFEADYDTGVGKRQVIEEAREGWVRLEVPGSPTVVMPAGERFDGGQLGLPSIDLDDAQGQRPTNWQPGICTGAACLDLLRGLLDGALNQAAGQRPMT
jgi:predicted DsbA family dithiol-disulfide isomerase